MAAMTFTITSGATTVDFLDSNSPYKLLDPGKFNIPMNTPILNNSVLGTDEIYQPVTETWQIQISGDSPNDVWANLQALEALFQQSHKWKLNRNETPVFWNFRVKDSTLTNIPKTFIEGPADNTPFLTHQGIIKTAASGKLILSPVTLTFTRDARFYESAENATGNSVENPSASKATFGSSAAYPSPVDIKLTFDTTVFANQPATSGFLVVSSNEIKAIETFPEPSYPSADGPWYGGGYQYPAVVGNYTYEMDTSPLEQHFTLSNPPTGNRFLVFMAFENVANADIPVRIKFLQMAGSGNRYVHQGPWSNWHILQDTGEPEIVHFGPISFPHGNPERIAVQTDFTINTGVNALYFNWAMIVPFDDSETYVVRFERISPENIKDAEVLDIVTQNFFLESNALTTKIPTFTQNGVDQYAIPQNATLYNKIYGNPYINLTGQDVYAAIIAPLANSWRFAEHEYTLTATRYKTHLSPR